MSEGPYNVIVAGVGIWECTVARLLAETGKRVLILEKRRAVGGNCRYRTIDGIEVHLYGSHIFHTSNEGVWKFVNRFVHFNDYRHSVIACTRANCHRVEMENGRRSHAERKVAEWLEGVDGAKFDVALEKLVEEKCAAGEYVFEKLDDKCAAIAAAKNFFCGYARRIVELSDGRCVYFAPDPRSRSWCPNNAFCWAEYAFHAVSSGGARIPGKNYTYRHYNSYKVVNTDLIEPTLRAERCVPVLKDKPEADAVKFFGTAHLGGLFDVVVRLDEYGNVNANMTEVTFEASTKRGQKKSPQLVSLAEAIRTVVSHQTATGTYPPNNNMIAHPAEQRKGAAHVSSLLDWQRARLATIHANRLDYGRGRADVTVLLYFFWTEDRAAAEWPSFECALRETWLRCGMMKTIIVANTAHRCLADFAARFSSVEVQVEPSLVPGRIATMSLDCITRLHTRFSTPYVLIVQNDGFPLRAGLDDFVGKYDFIGAPATRDGRRAVLSTLGFPCLNGGFSLRTRTFCERVSRAWNGFWRHVIRTDSRFFAEDTFCTFTAMLSPFFRRGLSFPSEQEAFRFAYESLNDLIAFPEGLSPFGFHGQPTAKKLLAEGRI